MNSFVANSSPLGMFGALWAVYSTILVLGERRVLVFEIDLLSCWDRSLYSLLYSRYITCGWLKYLLWRLEPFLGNYSNIL